MEKDRFVWCVSAAALPSALKSSAIAPIKQVERNFPIFTIRNTIPCAPQVCFLAACKLSSLLRASYTKLKYDLFCSGDLY